MDPPYPDPDLDLDVDAEGELDQLSSPATAIPTSAPLAATSGVAKRYRPAQAKTFQCRGYGECRMVFSRSEHLARHIRKHTGERPFNCHCGKQFSRLDNLRQHAQTVHADKPAENETMMRQLSSLHATITGQVPSPLLPTPAAPAKPAKSNGVAKATKGSATTRRPSTRRLKAVKVEEENITISQRPGTSTGYEGAAAYADMDVEPKQEQQPSPPLAARGSFRDEQQPQQQQQLPDGGQSFRDHRDTDQSFRVDNSQSFRAQQPYRQQRPSPTPSPPAYPVVDTNISNGISSVRVSPGNAANSGSFPFTNRLSSGRNGPASAGSRPGTGGGAPLPSLASLIPASSLTFRRTSAGTAGNTDGIRGPATNSILLPNSLTLRHPSTGDFGWDGFGSRPGTAPGKLATAFAFGAVGGGAANAGSIDDPSPFSFHPPDQSTTANGLGQSYINPRKRALSSAHGPYGAHPDDDGAEYGSQSRPASRRLSVMELINDDHAVQPSSVSAAIPVHREREWERERPITTNGLVSRASALVLDDEHAGEWEREREPRQRFAFEFGAGGQSLAASGEFDYEQQEAQMREALQLEQAEAEAEYHRRQQLQQHFYQMQQQEQEEQERQYHLYRSQQAPPPGPYLEDPHPLPQAHPQPQVPPPQPQQQPSPPQQYHSPPPHGLEMPLEQMVHVMAMGTLQAPEYPYHREQPTPTDTEAEVAAAMAAYHPQPHEDSVSPTVTQGYAPYPVSEEAYSLPPQPHHPNSHSYHHPHPHPHLQGPPHHPPQQPHPHLHSSHHNPYSPVGYPGYHPLGASGSGLGFETTYHEASPVVDYGGYGMAAEENTEAMGMTHMNMSMLNMQDHLAGRAVV
ncbi:hypothetical protein MKEN_00176000 [Mycena kentingensis (nom. inval.)]|nr:hypothetical protein MKEN_00176000 [Mycena kentingensis (nom. inval.)]